MGRGEEEGSEGVVGKREYGEGEGRGKGHEGMGMERKEEKSNSRGVRSTQMRNRQGGEEASGGRGGGEEGLGGEGKGGGEASNWRLPGTPLLSRIGFDER